VGLGLGWWRSRARPTAAAGETASIIHPKPAVEWRIASDHLAIVAADGVFSYYDLAQSAARVGAELLRDAPHTMVQADLHEQRVAFLVPPSFAYAVVSRGIWLAGGVAVPLAVSHPPAELEHVIRDAQASIVIGSGRQADALEAIAAAVGARFIRTPDLIATDAEPRPPVEPSPDRRAMIIYTSGTTGKPKGAVTTHGNMAAQIGSLLTAWEWSAADCALLALPLHHVHGIINVLGCALAAGASCEILPQFETEATWERLASGEITVFSAVPTIYHRLIQSWDEASPALQRARADGCRRMRLMMSGSAALPVKVLERWREITGHTLLERYGMTEVGMALSNPLRGERRPGFVGSPLPGVDVRLVDGELEIRGPGVFLEYWRRPEETREAFRDGWFRTGDAAIVEEGAYKLLGRSNIDIIKTGGYKVSALEIEDAIREHPGVIDCAVAGVPDAEWGERVCVALELRGGITVTLDELRTALRDRLAAYKLPRSLRCVPALPRNVMGKVIKQEIRTLFSKTTH
jgi:malonyl-CoA/methylmalonyl-CoA synthetase